MCITYAFLALCVQREPLPLASYGDERRKIHSHGGSFTKIQHSPVWSQSQSTRLLASRDSGHGQGSQSSSQKSQIPIILTNNNEVSKPIRLRLLTDCDAPLLVRLAITDSFLGIVVMPSASVISW